MDKNWLLIDVITTLILANNGGRPYKECATRYIINSPYICTCIKMDDSIDPKSFSSIILFYLFQLSRAPPPPRLLSFLIVLIRTFLYFLLEEIRNEFVIFWRKIHLKWMKKYCNLCCFNLMFCVLEIWRIYRGLRIFFARLPPLGWANWHKASLRPVRTKNSSWLVLGWWFF